MKILTAPTLTSQLRCIAARDFAVLGHGALRDAERAVLHEDPVLAGAFQRLGRLEVPAKLRVPQVEHRVHARLFSLKRTH